MKSESYHIQVDGPVAPVDHMHACYCREPLFKEWQETEEKRFNQCVLFVVPFSSLFIFIQYSSLLMLFNKYIRSLLVHINSQCIN